MKIPEIDNLNEVLKSERFRKVAVAFVEQTSRRFREIIEGIGRGLKPGVDRAASDMRAAFRPPGKDVRL